MQNEVIDIIKETKLLGVMISDDLSWDSNTSFLVKRSKARMRLLHKLVDFKIPQSDLVSKKELNIRLFRHLVHYLLNSPLIINSLSIFC